MFDTTKLEGDALSFYQDVLKNDKVIDCIYQLQKGVYTFYIVMAIGESPYSVISNTKRRFPSLGEYIQFSFIHQIPYDESGEISWQSLSQFPSLTFADLINWESILKSQPDILESAIVLQEHSINDPTIDLNIVLKQFAFPSSGVNIKERLAGFASSNSESEKLALSVGPEIQDKTIATKTLQDCLLALQGEQDKGIYFANNNTENFLAYGELFQESLKILNLLQKSGLQSKQFLIFQIQNQTLFLKTFWACILGGIIPAPISVPEIFENGSAQTQKLLNVLKLLDNPLVVSDQPESLNKFLAENNLQLKVVKVEDEIESGGLGQVVHVKSIDPCLILFTSGSTGVPKGVLLKHQNIMHMSAGTIQANQLNSSDITLNWMPLDHVGAIIFLSCLPIHLQCSQVHVPTAYILEDSLRWLKLIEKHKATISWAPNFAFSLINDREPEIKKGHWNLSYMRFLVNAGEQITEKTAKRFLSILGQHQLSEKCIVPAFGMSETCSGISWSLEFSLKSNNSSQNVVGLGAPIPGASFRIVSENNSIVKEGDIGKFQLKGNSVFSGYYRLNEINQLKFTSDGWFDTGDVGFLKDGHLYLTGRSKDDIIINGVNFFAHDIEQTIDELGQTEVSFTAACPVRLHSNENEKLCIFVVPRVTSKAFSKQNIRIMNEYLFDKLGVKADFIMPLQKGDIPKTGIGKIQKSILREKFEKGSFSSTLNKFYQGVQFSSIVNKSLLTPVWKSQRLKENAIAHKISVTNILVGMSYEIHQWINLRGKNDIYLLQQSTNLKISMDDVTQLDLVNVEHLNSFYHILRKNSLSRDLFIFLEAGQNNDELVSSLMSHQDLWSAWIRDVKLIISGDIADFEGKISRWSNLLRKLSKRKNCSVLLCDNLINYSTHELSNELFKAKDAMVYYRNGKRQVLSWESHNDILNDKRKSSGIKCAKVIVISGDNTHFSKEIVAYFKNIGFTCYGLRVFNEPYPIDNCVALEGNSVLEQISIVKGKISDEMPLLYLHISVQSPFYIFSEVAKAFGSKAVSVKVTSFQNGFDAILENISHSSKPSSIGRIFYLSTPFDGNYVQRDIAELLFFIESNSQQLASVRSNDAMQLGRLNSVVEPAFELTAYFVPKMESDLERITSNLNQKISYANKKNNLIVTIDSIEVFPRDYRGKIDFLLLAKKELKRKVNFRDNSKVSNKIASVWAEVLKRKEVPYDVTFFDLGGHSLLIAKTQSLLQQALGRPITILELFKYPTINEFAFYIEQLNLGSSKSNESGKIKAKKRLAQSKVKSSDIAIIGMACRYPGADSVESFWENLLNGKETISRFTAKEAAEAGVHVDWYSTPQYVFAAPVLENIDLFDAEFFGINSREADLMDPQQRVAIEVAWQTLERAGYNPREYEGSIGVYAGAGMNTYLINNVLPNRNKLVTPNSLESMNLESLGGFQVMVANDKDYIATRIAYCLDLKGSAVNVQTACSTTLVTVHMACQSLLNGEMDMALAGGVSIKVPQKSGYSHAEGMIVASDGHCKAYDENADGTIFGSGCGFVLLKRLEDALRDGDHIHAVVKGTSLNNDGGAKIGFTAPSERGESSVIEEALSVSGVDVESIGFVEGHGTGTDLGDPIEVSALTNAFRESTEKKGFCALGSVKSNVGHLQIASGIVGFMKAALVVENGLIPPTLHFKKANPKINFAESPFYVNTKTITWPIKGKSRIAGVNSLGIGGANTHAILEEANICLKLNQRATSQEAFGVISVSGKDDNGLYENLKNLYSLVLEKETLDYRDICYTANIGRVSFEKRFSAVVSNREDLLTCLKEKVITFHQSQNNSAFTKIAFLFSGQGSQYSKMASSLYSTCSEYRKVFDICNSVFIDTYKESLVDIIFSGEESLLNQTRITQPALFALEVSLAKYWIYLGVVPSYLMGHSLGEYAAACIAEVFSMEDGMRLVIARSRLMDSLQSKGGMLSVALSYEKCLSLIKGKQAWVAAINGPESIVLSGSFEDLNDISAQLEKENIRFKFLSVSHAFHSPQMNDMINDFRKVLEEIVLRPPCYEIVSNITGEVLREAFVDAHYWIDHILEPVDFYKGILFLEQEGVNAYLEIGPQATLLGLVKNCLPATNATFIPSLRKNNEDHFVLLNAVSLFYKGNVKINWALLHSDHKRKRVVLPTYAFQRKSYWIDIPTEGAQQKLYERTTDVGNVLGKITHAKVLKTTVFETIFSAETIQYCREHKVFGEIVIPGAGHLAMFLEAIKSKLGRYQCTLSDIVFPSVLMIGPKEKVEVQLTITESNDSYGMNLISSLANDEFITHASCKMHAPGSVASLVDLKSLRNLISDEIAVTLFYNGFENRKIELGNSFRCVEKLWHSKNQALAKIRVPENTLQTGDWELQPGVIDSCIQILMAVIPLNFEETLVPFGIESLQYFGKNNTIELWSHFQLTSTSNDGMISGDVTIMDEHSNLICLIKGFKVRRIQHASIEASFKKKLEIDEYEYHWVKKSRIEFKSSMPFGKVFLLFYDVGFDYSRILKNLQANGNDVVLVEVGESLDLVYSSSFKIRNHKEDCLLVLRQIREKYPLIDNCLVFLNNGGKDPSIDQLYSLSQRVLFVTQCLLELSILDPKGAVYFIDQDISSENTIVSESKLSSLTSAFCQVLNREHPNFRSVCFHYNVNEKIRERLVDDVSLVHSEFSLIFSDDTIYTPRLRKKNTSKLRQKPFDTDGIHIITGGLGGLGLKTAELLVQEGVKKIALLSRSQPNSSAKSLIDNWVKSGVQIEILKIDVSDYAELKRNVQKLNDNYSVKGIFHCAGILEDAMIEKQTWDSFHSVFQSKIKGTLHLDLIADELQLNLNYFICYSSISSVFGMASQANYGMGNRFIDALMRGRLNRNKVGLSINWGPWNEFGMASKLTENEKNFWKQKGIGYLEVASCQKMILKALHHEYDHLGQVIVCQIDWQNYLKNNSISLLQEFEVKGQSNNSSNILSDISNVSLSERADLIGQYIIREVSTVIGIKDSNEIDLKKGLMELGIDSLAAVDLKSRLEVNLKVALKATLAFDYPTLEGLIQHITSKVLGVVPTSNDSKLDEVDENDIASQLERELESLKDE